MATRKSAPETPQPLGLRVEQAEAKSRLVERMQIGEQLLSNGLSSYAALEEAEKKYQKWNDFNVALLKSLFTTDELANEYNASTGMVMMVMREKSLSEKVDDYNKRIDKKVHRLDSISERLTLFPVTGFAKEPEFSARPGLEREIKSSKKVFVVHGRDDAAKANLEAFLREIGLDPIVLHRQADEGMTVIEKFEKHSDVRYAFILLTPDEVSYLVSESNKVDNDRNKERRARPNVIFEWGYFVGKLGRSSVCCISTGDVTVPSDMNGLVTKRYISSVEEVGYAIIKDLRAAGIDAKMMA